MRVVATAAALLAILAIARAETEHPRIAVNFVIHLDPVARPVPEALKAETARRRDNLLWLQQFLDTVDKKQRPVLDIQIGGDQAEFYLQDEKGFAMLEKFWKDGHMVGTHFHRQNYLGEPHRWHNMPATRRSRPPEVPEGEVLTPGMMSEMYSLDEIRDQWRNHFKFTNVLIGKLAGLTDEAEIRKINNHGQNHSPTNWETARLFFKEFGITVQTGGRNEVFNALFDHDVFNPWRPSDQHALKEDLANREYVCVPQLAVLGNISPHFSVMQDLAVEAMQRRFLQIVAERREQQRLGLPPKIWNFGWTVHCYDMNPADYQPPRPPGAPRVGQSARPPGTPRVGQPPRPPGAPGVGQPARPPGAPRADQSARPPGAPRAGQAPPQTRRGMPRHSRREKIMQLVNWINERYLPDTAVWKTPNQAAKDFYAWEKENEGVSSFHYPHRKVVWEDYPYRLRGAAEALIGSHYVAEISDWTAQKIKLYELERVMEGSEWAEGTRGDAMARKAGTRDEPGETTRLLFGWSDGATETIDLSRYGTSNLTVIAGASGKRTQADAATVPIGPEPVVIELP